MECHIHLIFYAWGEYGACCTPHPLFMSIQLIYSPGGAFDLYGYHVYPSPCLAWAVLYNLEYVISDLYLHLLGKLCAWTEITCIMHSGHGPWAWLRWPTKDAIYDVHGLCRTIWSIFKLFCRWFRLIGYTYELLRCLDVEIWWFLWWRRQTDGPTDYFTPAHARGIIYMQIYYACEQYNTSWLEACLSPNWTDLLHLQLV